MTASSERLLPDPSEREPQSSFFLKAEPWQNFVHLRDLCHTYVSFRPRWVRMQWSGPVENISGQARRRDQIGIPKRQLQTFWHQIQTFARRVLAMLCRASRHADYFRSGEVLLAPQKTDDNKDKHDNDQNMHGGW